jgi:hypothetical protein
MVVCAVVFQYSLTTAAENNRIPYQANLAIFILMLGGNITWSIF